MSVVAEKTNEEFSDRLRVTGGVWRQGFIQTQQPNVLRLVKPLLCNVTQHKVKVSCHTAQCLVFVAAQRILLPSRWVLSNTIDEVGHHQLKSMRKFVKKYDVTCREMYDVIG